MHPILGTMMPKICEAPHLPTSRFQPSSRSELNEWGAFISFSLLPPCLHKGGYPLSGGVCRVGGVVASAVGI